MDSNLVDKMLTEAGWQNKGACAGCGVKKIRWTHPDKPDQEIKVAPRGGYFYHKKGNHTLKADFLENLKKYLPTI